MITTAPDGATIVSSSCEMVAANPMLALPFAPFGAVIVTDAPVAFAPERSSVSV